ncbi:MAG: hypothetical protein LBV17_03935 [Treponema sp.]|jgi:hypothetical protein|nr:hypothetical protein [Treponema sp.]
MKKLKNNKISLDEMEELINTSKKIIEDIENKKKIDMVLIKDILSTTVYYLLDIETLI